MASKIMSIAAFAALAMAIPNHPEHMGRSNIAREVSYDGSCGSWSGATCPDSKCCSADGWCGSSDIHCGTGCQVGFGKCNGGTPLASASPVQSPPAKQSPPADPPVYGGASSSSSAAAQHTGPAAPPPANSPTGAPTLSLTSTTSEVVTTTKVKSSSTDEAKSSSSADGKNPGLLPGHGTETTTSASLPHITSSSTTAPALTVSASISTGPAAKETGTTGGSGNKGSDSYTVYKGDGSSGAGWPSQDKWVSDFETMWAANLDLIKTGCAAVVGPGQPTPKDNSDAETASIKKYIESQSKTSGVDPRFALAIMMQESKGCVRVHSTNYGVENPGIFQDHNGKGMCNNDKGDAPIDPCPDSTIGQMVKDGVDGTKDDHAAGEGGDGLRQVLVEQGQKDGTPATDSSIYYRAARAYNSGSIAASKNLEDGIATHCYSTDIANRLTGWVKAPSTCPFDKAA